MLPLAVSLCLEARPFNAYVGLQYRQENLKLEHHEQYAIASLYKANWQQIRTPEMRFGGRYQPFNQSCSLPLTSLTNLLNSFCIVFDGGVLLNAASGKCQLHFGENLCTSEGFKQQGKVQTVHGGDFSIGLLHSQCIHRDLRVLFSLGYARQQRSYGLQPKIAMACPEETSMDMRHMRTKAYWQGPWVGIGLLQQLNWAWALFANLEFQRTLFKGNTRLKSEEHFSDNFYLKSANKWSQKSYLNYFKVHIGTSYAINACWVLALAAKGEFFSSSNGKSYSAVKQQLYAPWAQIGNSSKQEAGKLSLSWHSLAISGSINYVY